MSGVQDLVSPSNLHFVLHHPLSSEFKAQYSFRGSMIVIAMGFIPRSWLSVVSTMFMWESSQWLQKNIVQSTS